MKTGNSGGVAYLDLQRAYSNADVGRINFPIQEQHPYCLASLRKCDVPCLLGNPAFFP